MENLISPPKKIGLSDKDKNVMKVMQKKAAPPQKSDSTDIEKAKQQVELLIKQQNISPQTIVQIAEMAKQAISNKALYPMLMQYLLKNNFIDQEDIKQSYDYKLLSKLVVMGKFAQQMAGV
jgi:hypothetical protein